MSREENRARAAHLRSQGVIICGRGRGAPTEGDLDAVEAFAAWLRETPSRLTNIPPDRWPELFASRAEFEGWRARWLPYMAGVADGPSTAEQWPDYRQKIVAARADLTAPETAEERP